METMSGRRLAGTKIAFAENQYSSLTSCFCVYTKTVFEIGFQRERVWKRRRVPISCKCWNHKSRLLPKKRHFALLVISEHKLPVSSLRLFSAALQMRRSETNAASVCLRQTEKVTPTCLHWKHRCCLFGNFWGKILRRNRWEAVVVVSLTVSINLIVCLQFVEN